MPVRVNLKGLEDLSKRFPGFMKGLTKKIADDTPLNVINTILKGRSGLNDLETLPQNEISTINRKRAKGKPPLPLIDNRQLTTLSNWTVKRSGGIYKITLKTIRKKIAFHLHQGINSRRGKKIYSFMVKERSYIPSWLALIINRETTKFFAKYV